MKLSTSLLLLTTILSSNVIADVAKIQSNGCWPTRGVPCRLPDSQAIQKQIDDVHSQVGSVEEKKLKAASTLEEFAAKILSNITAGSEANSTRFYQDSAAKIQAHAKAVLSLRPEEKLLSKLTNALQLTKEFEARFAAEKDVNELAKLVNERSEKLDGIFYDIGNTAGNYNDTISELDVKRIGSKLEFDSSKFGVNDKGGPFTSIRIKNDHTNSLSFFADDAVLKIALDGINGSGPLTYVNKRIFLITPKISYDRAKNIIKNQYSEHDHLGNASTYEYGATGEKLIEFIRDNVKD